MRFAGFLSIVLAACEPDRPGCLDGDDGRCLPASPCARLRYTCEGGSVSAFRLNDTTQRPAGLDAQAAIGDYVLVNGRVTAVIDAPESPHHLADSGGSLLDLAPAGGADHLNAGYQITGILPRDAAFYRTAEIHDHSPGWAAIVVRGTLQGDSDVEVVTRYELGACDPGVRIRTEIYNGGRTIGAYFLGDGWWWGDRGLTPFIPLRGAGFLHPDLDLIEIDRSFRTFPFMAAQSHVEPHASYAVVACDRPSLDGIHSATISATGAPRSIVQPGDGIAHERVVLAASGPGLSGAVSLALDARFRLFDEAYGVLRGSVPESLGGQERLASLLVYEPGRGDPDDSATRTPRTEIVPGADGTFEVFLPARRSYRIEPHSFGRPAGAPVAFEMGSDADVGEIAIEAPATLRVSVIEVETAAPLAAEIILVPTADTLAEDVEGSVHGFFPGCAPFLGFPYGAYPACNRAMLLSGSAEIAIPAGTYRVYATAGPEATLAMQEVTLASGEAIEITLELSRLGLRPAGSLAADLHVHGGRSFDTAFPDLDRVSGFVATGIDVVAATDHDVVTSYEEAIAALAVGDRIEVLPGIEATTLVPWYYPAGSEFPLVVGHFNFWPLPYDPSRPRNGFPSDERLQPGALFDLVRPLVGSRGVMQLNHPMDDSSFGRDTGYGTVLGYDPADPVSAIMLDAPAGGHRNIDHDAQEVWNGPGVIENLRARALWFSFLSQGIVRAGTANSDSHAAVADAPVGYPRNYVLATGPLDSFDRDVFDEAIKAGQTLGSTGPVIEATVRDDVRRSIQSLTPITPGPGATLEITVRAAPWVPLTEVRVVVNGEVVAVYDPALAISVPVADLVGGRDGWIVVEAGIPFPAVADHDGDGNPDRIDGNDDGVVDPDEEELEPPPEDDPRYEFHVVAPDVWPYAFTNPFLIDVDGGGWQAPGLL